MSSLIPPDSVMHLDEDCPSNAQLSPSVAALMNSEPISSTMSDFNAMDTRQQQLRAHHLNLLETSRISNHHVSLPGFPKAANDSNPTSTFMKPDMLISALCAGLTLQSSQNYQQSSGFPESLFDPASKSISQFLGIKNSGQATAKEHLEPIIEQEPCDKITDIHSILAELTEHTGPSLMEQLSIKPKSSESNNNSIPVVECLAPSVAALMKSKTNGRMPNSNAVLSQERNGQNQKIRKPFFMPYMSQENVNRGLRNGHLIKGVLRVNQRNFEESYIDNPEGDECQDILILGIHDRNRSLHGDVVVVRLKERHHWIVRDSLYEAWRSGHLKAPCDDDGRPLTIPPVKPENNVSDEASKLSKAIEFLPPGLQSKIDKNRIKEFVPFPKNKRYTQDQMLRISSQIELQRIQNDLKESRMAIPVDLDEKAMSQISRLLITRNCKLSSSQANEFVNSNGKTSTTSVIPPASLASTRRANPAQNNTLQRRLNYRILGDMPDEDWGIPDVCLQKTAEVVYIAQAKNCRTAVGQLKVMADGNRNWALFSPNDSRIPRMVIAADEVPEGFFDRPYDFSKFIFIARLIDWQATAQFARGKLYKSLGHAGNIEAETEGLLISNDIDTREYSSSALSSLPIIEGQVWSIDKNELNYRRDFRQETLFTIDPKTARDLDDALHIKPIDDIDGKGTKGYEIGVHIADVSYFVQQNTELDKWASHRATSVYLVHKVIPMLPRLLCEDLCSLNSGVDRYTFSVVWKIDEEGNIADEWFGRSIIHSCVKFAYEHAQDIIENPTKEFIKESLPEIYNGKTVDEIKTSVLLLFKMSQKLKKRRVDNGSLRLDAIKLKFSLDSESGLPYGVSTEERKDANFLVEEFMLLANIAVAKKIESSFPEIALLRRHAPPKAKVLREMAEKCEILNFPIDITSSQAIANSLKQYHEDEEYRETVYPVLVQFIMKSMQLATYFCSSTEKSYLHYALNVPFYTHFTSPIRRYPDLIVHRLLAASLNYIPPPAYTVAEMNDICVNCNDRKTNAKAVSDQSAEMFFSLFIREIGTLDTMGIVIGVLDSAVDVYLLKYGLIKRCYTNRLKLARDSRFVEGTPGALILYWDPAYVAQARQNHVSKKVEVTAVENGNGSLPEKTILVDSGNDSTLDSEIDELVEESRKGANNALEQTLTIFSLVRLHLSSTNEPVKFTASIIPTPDKYPIRKADVIEFLK